MFFLLKSLMSEILSVRFQKGSKKVASISLIQNLLEWFIWTRKKNLWQIFHSSSGNSELLPSKRNLFEYDYEFLENLHRGKKVSTDTWFGLLTSLQKFESQNANTSIWRSGLMKRILVFFQKIVISVKFFLRTERIQFRHSCQQFKAKVTLFLCSKADK